MNNITPDRWQSKKLLTMSFKDISAFSSGGDFVQQRNKAAWSVTFDLLILEIKFLLFKNTVKYSNSGKHFTIFINLNKL